MKNDLKEYLLDLLKEMENGKVPKYVIICPKEGVTLPFYKGENIGEGVINISYKHKSGGIQELTVEKMYW